MGSSPISYGPPSPPPWQFLGAPMSLQVPKVHRQMHKLHLQMQKVHLEVPKVHLEVPKWHLEVPNWQFELPKWPSQVPNGVVQGGGKYVGTEPIN